jgi:dCTP deaminase
MNAVPHSSALSGAMIEEQIEQENLNVVRDRGEGLDIGPSSLDVHLHPEIKRIEGGASHRAPVEVTYNDESTYPNAEAEECGTNVLIHPSEFLLARTDEIFDLPRDTMAFLDGRSSIGRLGLFIQNAGLIDRGFTGTLTLELFNPTNNVIKLPVDSRVGQLTFLQHDRVEGPGYDGKYEGQYAAEPSDGHEDYDL